jgi:hypothetical protein
VRKLSNVGSENGGGDSSLAWPQEGTATSGWLRISGTPWRKRLPTPRRLVNWPGSGVAVASAYQRSRCNGLGPALPACAVPIQLSCRVECAGKRRLRAQHAAPLPIQPLNVPQAAVGPCLVYHSLDRNRSGVTIGIDATMTLVEPLTGGGAAVDHAVDHGLSVDATSSFNNNGE